MTFHADLERELFAACAANGVASYPQNVRDYAVSGDWAQASLDTGEKLRCALIVAADGARSKLRSQARITTIGRPYGQTAVIVTIEHAKDHEAVAFENFLPSGVLATLPLPGRRSSIVWVERSEAARRLVLASPDVFLVALQEAVGPRLGLISLVGAPRAFALNLQLARSFVGERIALIGDAAHVIHPLAGQGLNLGLRDVMALTEAIVRQRRLGLDPADAKSLRAYERRRRPDALMMAGLTDGLDRIFSSTSNLVRGARGLGLSTIDRQPSLKNMLVAAAAAQRAQGSDREPSVVSRYE